MQGLMLQQPASACILVHAEAGTTCKAASFSNVCLLILRCRLLLECSSRHCSQLWQLTRVHTVSLMSSGNLRACYTSCSPRSQWSA